MGGVSEWVGCQNGCGVRMGGLHRHSSAEVISTADHEMWHRVEKKKGVFINFSVMGTIWKISGKLHTSLVLSEVIFWINKHSSEEVG